MIKVDFSGAVNHYDPSLLQDPLTKKLLLLNDAMLARMLCNNAPVLSKIPTRKSPVSAALLIRMHEMCGLEVAELRKLMGDRRAKFRFGDQGFSMGARPTTHPELVSPKKGRMLQRTPNAAPRRRKISYLS